MGAATHLETLVSNRRTSIFPVKMDAATHLENQVSNKRNSSFLV